MDPKGSKHAIASNPKHEAREKKSGLSVTSPNRLIYAKSHKSYLDQNISNSKSAWEKIIADCKRKNEKFIDEEFPRNLRSLYADPDSKLNTQNVFWARPERISVEDSHKHLPWRVFNNPGFSDVSQGKLGNCWLLSSNFFLAVYLFLKVCT